jgi:hypothetical protein
VEAAARVLELPVLYVAAFAAAVGGRSRRGWSRPRPDGDRGYEDGCAVQAYLWGGEGEMW